MCRKYLSKILKKAKKKKEKQKAIEQFFFNSTIFVFIYFCVSVFVFFFGILNHLGKRSTNL